VGTEATIAVVEVDRIYIRKLLYSFGDEAAGPGCISLTSFVANAQRWIDSGQHLAVKSLTIAIRYNFKTIGVILFHKYIGPS
jgi:hypothetical protein